MSNKIEAAIILLIEDEPDINLLARTALMVKGYEVLWAFNGTDGISLAKENQIDLIVLDVSMPEMNGYEVAAQLKKEEETKDIPIVFFSAFVQKSEIQKGLELGAIGYINKPFDTEKFPMKINELLQKSSNVQNGSIEPEQKSIFQIEYLNSMQEKLNQLDEFVAKEAYGDISTFGHRIAGSGASYGFPQITDLGREIEHAGEIKDLNAVKKLQTKLAKEIIILQTK